MASKERHIELFDKYVLGTITKAEEKEMHLLIKNDPELELEFKTHKLLAEGIKLARKEELKDYLKEHGKVEYFQNIWGKKWRSASAVIVLLFTCSFFIAQYLSKKAANEMTVANKEDVLKTEKTKEQPGSNPIEKPITEESDITLNNSRNITQESLDYKNIEVFEDAELIASDAMDTNRFVVEGEPYFKKPVTSNKSEELKKEYKDLPIAEEKKLFDTTFIAQVYSSRITDKKDNTQSEAGTEIVQSKARNASAKNNVELKEKESLEATKEQMVKDTIDAELKNEKDLDLEPNSIFVEFWQSPLNFKGYQYQSALKLYGVKSESISIIQYDYILYMKVSDQYCKIVKSKEYLPFKFIKDINLIQKLNGN